MNRIKNFCGAFGKNSKMPYNIAYIERMQPNRSATYYAARLR